MPKDKRFVLQNLLYSMGMQGCYVLCLMHIAKKRGASWENVVEGLLVSIHKGIVLQDFENKGKDTNCYVTDAPAFLKELTGKNFNVMKCTSVEGFEGKKDTDIVYCYQRATTKGNVTHFFTNDFDPYPTSETREKGTLLSTRIIQEIKK